MGILTNARDAATAAGAGFAKTGLFEAFNFAALMSFATPSPALGAIALGTLAYAYCTGRKPS